VRISEDDETHLGEAIKQAVKEVFGPANAYAWHIAKRSIRRRAGTSGINGAPRIIPDVAAA
jgi:hypothetical protein